MFNGYRIIFWGIFFTSFHINLGMIQILPTFIAWIIVANGIGKLIEIESSDSFLKAKSFALIAAGMSFVSGLISLYSGNGVDDIILLLIWPVVIGILELVAEYKILEGSVEYLYVKNDVKMAEEYINMTRNYTIAFIIFIVVQCIALSFLSAELIMIVAIAGLILRIFFMGMMTQLKNLYEEGVVDI